MPHSTQTSARDTGLASLVFLARYHGRAADGGQLRHMLGIRDTDEFGNAEILRGAQALDLKARSTTSDWQRLQRTHLPAIARHADGHFFIVAAINDDKVLIQDPLETRPLTLPRTIFESAWSGELILVTRRATLKALGGRFGFGWFVPAIVRHRKLFGEVVAASFFLQLFALVTPLFFQVIIDKVLVHHGLTTLHVLAIGLLALSLFEVVLGGLRTYVFAHTTNRVDVLLGAKLFAHLLRLPLAYFEARRVGDSVARVRELENIRNFLTGSALTLVIDLLFTLVFFAVLYYYSPLLTAVVAGAIPFYIVLSLVVTPILRGRLEEKFNRGAENQAFLVESISGIQTLKAMAVEPQMQRRWEEQLAGYVGASFRASNLGNIASQSAGFVNKVTVVLILWIGATAVMHGELSVGQLIAFNMIAGRISGPILRLVQLWQDFQQAGISVRRLGDIMNTRREAGGDEQRSSLPRFAGAIAFEGVRFRYRVDAPEILPALSLQIRAGEMVGVVGPSGCGKSTLAKLIQRLYVPEAGRVLIDGIDLAGVDPGWVRGQIGVVPQENELFNGSVRENIALAHPGAEMAVVERAARLAGAHDFILALAHGYDTQVGEQGVALSGGQRQRIAIARALIGDPGILILDEATSALDADAEAHLQRRLEEIARGRTLIVITHRLGFLAGAKRILVMDRGRIVEQGAPGELLRAGGRFAQIYRRQSAAIVRAEGLS